jgi:hypothetical protein
MSVTEAQNAEGGAKSIALKACTDAATCALPFHYIYAAHATGYVYS